MIDIVTSFCNSTDQQGKLKEYSTIHFKEICGIMATAQQTSKKLLTKKIY